MSSKDSSARIAGRLAVFSTLAAMCALLACYALVVLFSVGYFTFVLFLMLAALMLWASFYTFARRYQTQWFDEVINHNKELQLQALFSTLNPWPVLRFDRYGQLISKNSRAKTFFYGHGTGDRSVFDFFPELTKETWQDVVFQEYPLELEHNRSGFWLCFFFRAHLQLGVINVYGYDVTRYKRLQQEAAKEQGQFKALATQTNHMLQDAFRSLHNPAKKLREALDNDAIQNKMICQDIKVMTDIASRLEDIAELEPSTFRIHNHSFDCRFMFEKILAAVAKKAFARNGELVVDCDFGCHETVMTDGRRLQQAVEAALGYAISRSKNGLTLVKARWIADVGLSEESALDHSVGYNSDAAKMVWRMDIHDSGRVNEYLVQMFQEKSDLPLVDIDLNIRFLQALVPLVGGTMNVVGSALGGHHVTIDWPVERAMAQVQVESDALSDLHVFVYDVVALSAEAIAKTLARAGTSVDYSDKIDDMFDQIAKHTPNVVIFGEQSGHVITHEALRQIRQVVGTPVALCLLAHQGENLNDHRFDSLAVEAIITKPVREKLLFKAVKAAWKSVTEPRTSTLQTQETPSTGVPRRPSVLVVDDDLVVLHLVSDLVSEMGADVEVVETAAKGFSLLSRMAFDLVILDVRMPEMSGFEAAQEIRAAYGDIPIVALTASEDEADRVKAVQVGMNDYVVKPVDRDVLAQTLSKWILLPGLDAQARSNQQMQVIDEQTPLIQVREAIRLLSQDVDIFTRSLCRFYGRFYQEGKVITGLLNDHQPQEIIRRLHGLRGGAANIGAYRLRDQIFLAEKQLRQDGICDQTCDTLDSLVTQIDAVMAEGASLLDYFLNNKEQIESQSIGNLDESLRDIQSAVARLAKGSNHEQKGA